MSGDEYWYWRALKVGDKAYIRDEKRPYYVKCRDDRFIICTKPYNPKHTVYYFIVDLQRGVRGTDDRVFCNGYETNSQCLERLSELQNGEINVSSRNCVPLETYTGGGGG